MATIYPLHPAHCNQGQSALIPSTPQELFLLALFGSRQSERAPGKQRRKTSLPSSSTDTPHGRSSLKITLLPATHTQKNQPCGQPHELPATVIHLLRTQEPTQYDTKNNLFSLWPKSTSAIRINLSFLCFKEVSLSIFFCKLIYSDMESYHIAQSAGTVEYTDCFSAEG